ncbi:GNAT family N-acetyltransferase [Paenibacillus nanensis]|uniref:GNAT family N-acetyltransferase n=1 Tax=Paenibacillus nanensis TaxID=393251 RepID=A0A3A1VED9_9BACL|nr:GNAT family N-acetyltransferase [Paenibacillus nanensis]RIX59279.1 GNAT family N-acetyltransferase [Paenibacillus nanensis]
MLLWEYIDAKHLPAIENFECTDEPSIKTYLIEEALKFHEMNLAKTKLFFDRENNLVGFLTLYNDMMQIGRKKRKKHGLSELPSYKWYPAIKLHYMGVDSRFRNKGYGRYILLSALTTAKELSEATGCLFLTVESLMSAVSFYERHEFDRLSINGKYLNMFFKVNELY